MKKFYAVILRLALCGQMWSSEIISLGGACNVARASRQSGLRTLAYPFDWLITPLPALKEAFEEDFVKIAEKMHLREDGKAAIDAYGLVYIHDFPTIRTPETPIDGEIMPVHPLVEHWEEAIPIVQAKFRCRLARMTKLLEAGSPVALVRYQDMGRREAEEWIDLLRNKYPSARLVLAVLGSTSEFQTPWDIPHVRNFYISEKDLRDWQGPIWNAILQEIAALEPTEWNTDGYVLTMPNYNPGLFSTFNTIMGALDAYDCGRISSLRIDFGKQGSYFDLEQGDNWWTYYFEPISLGRGTELFPTYKKIEFAYKAQYEMSKERAYALIQKYIHVLPHIDQKVQEFCKENFDGHFVIGLHYRGTDKSTEAESVSYDQIQAALAPVLLAHKDEAVKIFLATDDAFFAQRFQKDFSNYVVMRNTLRSNTQEGIHARKDLNGYRKGEEAVIDCLLLARCSFLLKMASNLSDCSLRFQPDLPVIHLNKSYSE